MTENTYYKPRLVIGNQEISLGMGGIENPEVLDTRERSEEKHRIENACEFGFHFWRHFWVIFKTLSPTTVHFLICKSRS